MSQIISDELQVILQKLLKPKQAAEYTTTEEIAQLLLEDSLENIYFNNGLKLEGLDVSDKQECLKILVKPKTSPTSRWINFSLYAILGKIFDDTFTKNELTEFIDDYTNLVFDTPPKEKAIFKAINPKELSDIAQQFLSLVTKTYPYKTEAQVRKLINIPLDTDKFGNYYKVIGKSNVMFTSHFDTACAEQVNVKLLLAEYQGDQFLCTNGSSILGADDKAGVTIMLHMIKNNIPGVYYFFLGEEVGAIGSKAVSNNFDEMKHLHQIKKVISFDRRAYNSVITKQLGSECCSDKFGHALVAELNKGGMNMSLDPTGVFTDSASFMDIVSECTNISVGYFNEHTGKERQNITFLEKLAKAVLVVDWESLPVVRKVGLSEESRLIYNELIQDVKSASLLNPIKFDDKFGFRMVYALDESDVDDFYEDLLILNNILNTYEYDMYTHKNEFHFMFTRESEEHQ